MTAVAARRLGRTAAALITAALLTGCARGPLTSVPPPEPIPAGEEGIASWYGPGFHGRRTTSGEIYNQHDLTAAHRTLPLGTRVAVTNLHNGRVANVRINDRGPFVEERIIDLSHAAALKLDMIEAGTAKVRIELVGSELPTLPRVKYEVQVGAFADPQRAAELQERLRARFEDVRLTTREAPDGEYWRVRIGPYEQREEAASAARRVSQLGFPALVVEEEGPPQ